ncbi:hypothetical protein BDV28DRAFT_157070 [Aspergillus coremiiformis]|uniref:BZIP domain-containing protein n=1 Tax=Aspergillus coremiiformis TaxID=138285 RepID=A0A5N6Z9H7_9EURO|nr:hypothetical protein BDV28DRAFT_157070 [Aspergillus coremiiformis]
MGSIRNWPIEVSLLEDWRRINDPETRRTIQNRLNKRAHRCRQRARKAQARSAVPKLDPVSPPLNLAKLDGFPLYIVGPGATETPRTLRFLEAAMHAEFAKGSLRTELLLSLTRLNIVRALHANLGIIGYIPTEMHDDAVSVFCMAGTPDQDAAILPPALQPTALQRSIPHHPWLDLIPISQMRDNLIQAGDTFDDWQLCHDLCGHRSPDHHASKGKEETGVIVWKDPWDPSGWEVTPTFLQNWGWVVRDCWGLFASTNMWRAQRGEAPLFRLPPG